jgi:hypothetical protein
MWLPIAASAASWGFLFWLFPPGGQDFPLHDDWAFAKSAFAFAAGQGIHYYGWSSMPQLGQWLWAWPFIKLFGPSFVTLRVSTIVLSWLGLVGLYNILRREGSTPWLTSFATGTVAFNPVFFALQGSFMTDVPALSFMLIALALFGRAAESGKLAPLLVATAAGLLAVSTRQNAILVALATVPIIFSAVVRKHGTPAKSEEPGVQSQEPNQAQSFGSRLSSLDSPLFLCSCLLIIIVGLATDYWFASRHDIIRLAPAVPSPARVLLLPYWIVHWLGLALLPVLVLGFNAHRTRRFVYFLLVMLAVALYWRNFAQMLPYPRLQMDGVTESDEAKGLAGYFPYTGGVLGIWGIFSGAMYGRPIYSGVAERMVITVLGCIGGAALLSRMGGACWKNSLVWLAVLQIPLLFAAPLIYDRYLLPLLPGACLVAVSVGWRGWLAPSPLPAPPSPKGERREIVRWVGVALLAGYAGLSIAFVHDCFEWNRARWALARETMADKIPAQAIEGGFEWDGWTSLNLPSSDRQAVPPAGGLSLPYTRRNFPAITGQYSISFKVLPGTESKLSLPIRLWLLPGERFIYLVRRS